MTELKLDANKRALVLVAHPDDETIWMGGTILLYPRVKWTIFSLCRLSDPDRQPKFQRVCRHYGARAIITDLEDEDKLSPKETIPIIKRYVIDEIKEARFNYVFTHGQNGEYGHLRHIGINLAVRELIKAKDLVSDCYFSFNYKKARLGKHPSMEAKKSSQYFIKLPLAVFMEKKRIQAEMYGYAWDGIDVGLCTKVEAFKNI